MHPEVEKLKQPRNVCIHEASHAIVAARIGVPIRSIRAGHGVEEDGTRVNGIADCKDRTVFDTVAICLAGALGEAIVLGERRPGSATEDYRIAGEAIRSTIKPGATEDEIDAQIKHIITEASDYVCKVIEYDAYKIHQVADELEEVSEMSGDDVMEIVKPKFRR